MAYFNELPNLSYVSRLKGSNRSSDKIEVKNIFKRAKLRSDIDQIITAFEYYEIEGDTRPDTLAYQLYEDTELDWVILTVNNITNVRDEWPLSNNDLHQYMLDQYGSEAALQESHHYITTEVKDSYGRIVLEKGLIVDEGYQFTYNDGNSTLTVNPSESVSNYQYESEKNDNKRRIKILKKSYLAAFVTDMRNMMRYTKSSDYLNRGLKNTYNERMIGV